MRGAVPDSGRISDASLSCLVGTYPAQSSFMRVVQLNGRLIMKQRLPKSLFTSLEITSGKIRLCAVSLWCLSDEYWR